jgi:hypothetical protein
MIDRGCPKHDLAAYGKEWRELEEMIWSGKEDKWKLGETRMSFNQVPATRLLDLKEIWSGCGKLIWWDARVDLTRGHRKSLKKSYTWTKLNL